MWCEFQGDAMAGVRTSLYRALVCCLGVFAAAWCRADAPSPRAATGEKYAVVLSIGPQAGVPWGGYHVTITGYSSSHACVWNPKQHKKVCASPAPILSSAWRNYFGGQPWCRGICTSCRSPVTSARPRERTARWIAGRGFHRGRYSREHAGVDDERPWAYDGRQKRSE